MTKLAKSSMQSDSPTAKGNLMIKLKSTRYKDRVHVEGNTSFKFNHEGICEVIDDGYVGYDVASLLKKNGFSKISEISLIPVPEVKAASADKSPGEGDDGEVVVPKRVMPKSPGRPKGPPRPPKVKKASKAKAEAAIKAEPVEPVTPDESIVDPEESEPDPVTDPAISAEDVE